MKRIDRLPRDSNGDFEPRFKANGKEYFIRNAEDGIGIIRYAQLMKMSSVWAFGLNIGTQVANWQKIDQMLNGFVRGENNLHAIFAHIGESVKGIKRDTSNEYLATHWTACLFITAKGEDLTKFVESEQKVKINDWVTAGLHEKDFEELVKKKLVEFSKG